MNRTASGSIAVGNSMSLARLQQEINHYCGPEGTLEKFAMTPEGEALIRRYWFFTGGYPEDMAVADMLECINDANESERLQYVLYGALFALEYAMAGRVTEPRGVKP